MPLTKGVSRIMLTKQGIGHSASPLICVLTKYLFFIPLEGNLEASFQFVLQLCIIFKRADREPSIIQMLSLCSSLMSIVKANAELIFSEKPQTTFITKALHFPRILIDRVSVLVPMALLISIIQWNYLLLFPR